VVWRFHYRVTGLVDGGGWRRGAGHRGAVEGPSLRVAGSLGGVG
jgi:hypothetical protein